MTFGRGGHLGLVVFLVPRRGAGQRRRTHLVFGLELVLVGRRGGEVVEFPGPALLERRLFQRTHPRLVVGQERGVEGAVVPFVTVLTPRRPGVTGRRPLRLGVVLVGAPVEDGGNLARGRVRPVRHVGDDGGGLRRPQDIGTGLERVTAVATRRGGVARILGVDPGAGSSTTVTASGSSPKRSKVGALGPSS